MLRSTLLSESLWSAISAFSLCGCVHFAKLAHPTIKEAAHAMSPEVGAMATELVSLLIVLFGLLVIIGCPPFAGKAFYNPCVAVFKYFGGVCSFDDAVIRLLGQAIGATLAVKGLTHFVALFPKEFEGMPLKAPRLGEGVDFNTAVMVEAGVAASVILGAGIIEALGFFPTPLKQMANAAVYIGVLVAEQGKYTGSIMNPLTVTALSAHELGGYAPLAMNSTRLANHLAPYALGAFLGSAGLGLVMRGLGLVPGQSARRNVTARKQKTL